MKDEFPRSVGTQYATREEWRNNSRKNEETDTKQKQCTEVDVMEINFQALIRTRIIKHMPLNVYVIKYMLLCF